MLSSFRSSVALAETAPPNDWRSAVGWLLAAGLVQATILHFFAIRGAVPSLIVIVVAIYASRSGIVGAIVFGAAAGLLDDALSGNTGAAWTISTTLVSLCVSLSSRFLFTDSFSIFAAIVVAGTLLREGLYWGVISVEGYPTGLGTHFAKMAVLASAYTGIIVLIVSWARWRFQPTR